MGFHFTGSMKQSALEDLDAELLFEKDKKQHLNLSESAWLVVNQDIKNFYLNENEESKSGFFNTILKNFYENSNASINKRCESKRAELARLFCAETFALYDGEVKQFFIDKYIEVYQKELTEKALRYPKGHGEKFRINVENVLLLKDEIHEEKYYDNTVGLYLKALYEEYCEKQNYEREQIFFKDVIEKIQQAIDEAKKIKITIKEKYSAKSKAFSTRKYYVSPYKIVQDETKNYNYLIGWAEEIGADNEVKGKQIASFKISYIDRIMVMKSMSGFISKDNREKLGAELMQKKAPFMAGELIDVKVRFTKAGLESFHKQLYMRPQCYKKADGEELVYIFNCTAVQAINYFFKFAREVEILEPADLRENFRKRYADALANYPEEK